MARPERLELPAFWFVANGVNMLNALFGVACRLETPFFPQLAAPNVARKTKSYRIRKITQLARKGRPSLRLQGSPGSKTGGYQRRGDEKRDHRGNPDDLSNDRNNCVFR